MSRLRHLLVVAVVAVLVAGLAACQRSTTSCSGGSCTVHLSGGKGSVKLDGRTVGSTTKNVFLRWEGTSDGTATIALDGDDGTCTQDQSITVGSYAVTCTAVTDDELDLSVRGT